MAFLVEVSPEQSGREGDMNVVQRSMLAMLLLASAARADRQAIAPGTGLQSAVEVDSGANGIAETRARGAELQLPLANPRPPFMPMRRRGPARRAVKLAVFNDEPAAP